MLLWRALLALTLPCEGEKLLPWLLRHGNALQVRSLQRFFQFYGFCRHRESLGIQTALGHGVPVLLDIPRSMSADLDALCTKRP